MKSEKLLLLGALLLSSLFAGAQDRSIRFENGTFQEALEKAKKENKLLFIDCYTSWCGPCKMLARDVFTNNAVADYFNERFISLKVDCEEGEGPELRKRFGVSSYPTMIFIDGQGKVVGKLFGASDAAHFIPRVEEALNAESAMAAKEKKYAEGNRDRDFLLDLINTYKKNREAKKAAQVSLELLSGLSEQELVTKEMWEVVRDYYVSGYGSKWWNFIIEHADQYSEVVGKDAVGKKVGETLHPILFGYAAGLRKMGTKSEFKIYQDLVDRSQPGMKDILYDFIRLGESASFDDFNGYFKTVLKVVPELDMSEHYRFFCNALGNLLKNASPKQKKQLLKLMKESQAQQNEYIAPLYQEFFDKVEKS